MSLDRGIKRRNLIESLGLYKQEPVNFETNQLESSEKMTFISALMVVGFVLARALSAYAPTTDHGTTPNPTPSRIDTIKFADAIIPRDVTQVALGCLLTTLSCTWISVHPNLSFFGRISWHRIYFLFLALIFPEIMATWTFMQATAAFKIQLEVNSISSPPRRKWAVSHTMHH